MNTAPRAVSQPVTLELIRLDRSSAIEAELWYDPRDPFAVTTVFLTGERRVRWTFGRDLLARGLYQPTGAGDVRVRPGLDLRGHAVVVIELIAPTGGARVQARARDVQQFVDLTRATVRPGMEWQHTDIDSTIAEILVGKPAD